MGADPDEVTGPVVMRYGPPIPIVLFGERHHQDRLARLALRQEPQSSLIGHGQATNAIR